MIPYPHGSSDDTRLPSDRIDGRTLRPQHAEAEIASNHCFLASNMHMPSTPASLLRGSLTGLRTDCSTHAARPPPNGSAPAPAVPPERQQRAAPTFETILSRLFPGPNATQLSRGLPTPQTRPTMSRSVHIAPHGGQNSTNHQSSPFLAHDSLTYQMLEHPPEFQKCATMSFRGPNGAVGNRDANTHHLHWYPAKMFYRIPAVILDALRLPSGSTVLDPFCGSGTVLVEAISRGYSAIGIDLHPIATLISRVKTTPLCYEVLHSYLVRILGNARSLRRLAPEPRLPTYWFRAPARNALYRLYCAIDLLVQEPPYRDFFFASLTNITRRCSMADPAIPPPVRMRAERAIQAGPRYQRALHAALRLDTAAVYRQYETVALRNTERVCDFLTPHSPSSSVIAGSALSMHIPDGTIDAIITSPPYCGAQKYVRSFRLELLLLGYTPDQIRRLDRATLGTERGFRSVAPSAVTVTPQSERIITAIRKNNQHRSRMLTSYLYGLSAFASEVYRVLRPSSSAFISFGTSRFAGVDVDLADCFSEVCIPLGLRLVAKLSDRIPSRGLITRRHPSAGVISTEHVLWLRKE